VIARSAASAAYWASADAQACAYWWTRSMRSTRSSEPYTHPSRQPVIENSFEAELITTTLSVSVNSIGE